MGSPLGSLPDWGSPTLQDFDVNNIVPGERIRGSARQYVRFYKKTIPTLKAKEVRINERTGEVRVVKTEVEQIEREFVQVKTPGDKNEFDGIAEDYHRREFWPQYKAFRDGRTAPLGKDVEECEYISSGVATELKYHGCHTEEQLADASDLLCNQIPSGWELREYARAMCQVNSSDKSSAQVSQLKSELQNAKATASKMQEQLVEMQKQMAAMQGMILDSKGSPITSDEPTEIIKRRDRPSKLIVGE